MSERQTMELLTVEIRNEADVVLARQRARDIGEILGLRTRDATATATAVSELVRNALQYAGDGCAIFSLVLSEPPSLQVRVIDEGPGIPHLETVMLGRYTSTSGMGRGLLGARALVDEFDIDASAGGTRVTLHKNLPFESLSAGLVDRIRKQVAELSPRSAYEEVRRQNQELIQTIEERKAAEDALRRSEARLTLAVETAGLGDWYFDSRTGRFILSRTARELLGLGGANGEFTRGALLRNVHPEDLAAVRAALASCVDADDEQVEFRVNRVGASRWLTMRMRGVTAQEGHNLAVGTLVDVTEQKERERDAQLRAMIAEQLMGIVSHDLRNPLGIINNCAFLLQQVPLEPEDRELVDAVRTATRRAADLVNDLLDFTQASLGGGIPIEPAEGDIHDLVDEIVRSMNVSDAGRIVHHASGDGHGTWDSGRISQVISNLLDNALRHSPDDSSVEVTTIGDADEVVVRIRNAGEPIPDELLPHIFEPMRRGRRSSGGGGHSSVGLGLYIVDQIVRSHAGHVDVDSSEDRGTAFVVHLPREAS